MRLVQIAGCRTVERHLAECGGGGSCPSVFVSDDGRLVVQGYKLSDDLRSAITVPSNEDAVEIPANLLEEALVALKKAHS
jgi:hypothetical protein